MVIVKWKGVGNRFNGTGEVWRLSLARRMETSYLSARMPASLRGIKVRLELPWTGQGQVGEGRYEAAGCVERESQCAEGGQYEGEKLAGTPFLVNTQG
jgi:hypothetical protein